MRARSITRIPRALLIPAVCAAACACQPATDDVAVATDDAGPGTDAATDTSPPPGEPAGGDTLAGAFNCVNGTSVRLDWGEDDVVVRWPDGRSATLPKAESASGPNGDAYVGDTVSLEHDGDRIVIHDGDGPPLACDAASASAAAGGSEAEVTMRYACEPDTGVTVFADDSALVALPDGQEVPLWRIAGSTPAVFTGGSLYFSIGESGAFLSQGDRTNELACSPA